MVSYLSKLLHSDFVSIHVDIYIYIYIYSYSSNLRNKHFQFLLSLNFQL